MEYVSKERLLNILADPCNMDNKELTFYLRWLIGTECQELPDQQWQTIDEFKNSPSFGQCWVSDPNGKVISTCYKNNGKFYESTMSDYYVSELNIWYVMPIKTPEAPK